MKKRIRLQLFDFKNSRYERPNQAWVCGRLAEGKPCQVGPTGTGQCRGAAECRPMQKGDRWVCTRPAGSGGKCEDGPNPDGSCCKKATRCAPVPSMRTRRGAVAKLAIAVAVGLTLLLIGFRIGDAVLLPGQLSNVHTEIGDCSTCHSAEDMSPGNWVHHLFADTTEAADKGKCLTCHQGRGGLAHNQSAEQLAHIAETVRKPTKASGGPFFTQVAMAVGMDLRTGEKGELACRNCHQEHKGHTADITAMTNAQCQTCHSGKFESFAEGHPEFGAYPFERRTRIRFDHTRHFSKYFTSAQVADKAPQQCMDCHEADLRGELMLVKGFDQTCSTCHAPITTANPVTFVSIPGLDVESLIDLEVAIGEWPEDSENEEFAGFADALLAGDEAYVEARLALEEEDIDLLDLSELEDEQLEQVKTVAWAIKGLIHDLLVDGKDGVIERLSEASGAEINEAEARALLADLPMEAVRSMQVQWFPNLMEEVAAYRDGEDVEIPEDMELPEGPDDDGMASEDWAAAGGWFMGEFSLGYQFTGHADSFARSWLNLATTTGMDEESALHPVMLEMTDPKGPGGCAICHSIDEGDGMATMNWKARHPDLATSQFTQFRHEPHFSLIGDEGCLTCHSLDKEADYAGSFSDWDPSTFSSNFKLADKAFCSDCHTPSQAGDNCTACHNYHVGEFAPLAVTSPMME